MKIWLRNRPAFLASTAEVPATIVTVVEGTVALDGDGDDPSKVIGFDPTGGMQVSANHGPYELMSVDTALPVLNYTNGPIPFAVVYRGR